MCKKVWHTCKLVLLLNKPIAVLTFSLPSPLSLLKLPFLLIIPSTRPYSLWNLRNYLHGKRQNYSFISNKNFSQALFQTLPFVLPLLFVVLFIRDDDGDGKQDVKKVIGLLRKTTHHAFLYISLPSLHDYDVKMPNCIFYGGRKQATTNLFFPI